MNTASLEQQFNNACRNLDDEARKRVENGLSKEDESHPVMLKARELYLELEAHKREGMLMHGVVCHKDGSLAHHPA